MAKEKEKEIEFRSGLTPKALIIGIVLIVALSFYMVMGFYTYAVSSVREMTPSDAEGTLSVWWMFWSGAAFTFFAPLLVFVLLPERLRLTRQELTVIFAMIVVTYPLVAKVQPELWDAGHLSTGWPGWATGDPYVNMMKWIAPYHFSTYPTPESREYINGGWVGRPLTVAVPVDWSKFLSAFVFVFFEIMLQILMMIFIAAIIRKQYVEIEALPFPNATIGTTLINEATTKPEGISGWFATKPKLLSNKWLWLGFLLAQVFMIPAWLGMLLPYAGIDTTPYRVYTYEVKNIIIPMIPIQIVFTNPWALGFGMLMPLEVLISWFITWIVFIVILTNLQWMMGIFPPPPENADAGWYVGRAVEQWFIPTDPSGQGLCAWSWGILLVAAFYPMWVHRKHVIATIRAIWQPSPELERGQIPYKWLYLGLLLSFVGYLALFAITGIGPYLWITVIFYALFLITIIGVCRVRAETGAYGGFWAAGYDMGYRYPNHWAPRVIMQNMFGAPTPAGIVTGENAKYFWVFQSTHNFWNNETPPYAVPMPTMLESFKIAYDTRTRTRDLIIAVVIALIVAYWIGNPMITWLRHSANWREDTFSYKTDMGHDLYTGGIASRGSPVGWRGYWYMGYGAPMGPDITNTVIQYVIGAVVGVVLFWLRARFPAFIYNPLTIPLWGLFGWEGSCELFLMFLLALIIKFFTIRTYGVLWYEQKMIPLAIGVIIGGAFFFTVDDILIWAFRRVFV